MPTTPATKPTNQHSHVPRTRINGNGPYVAQETMDQLTTCNSAGLSFGITIDRWAAHAKRTGYDPVTDTVTKKGRK